MTVRRKTRKTRIVVTAGPTREKIDPVRYISNYSTGRFGYEIAKEAFRRGCRVALISGPAALEAPPGVKVVRVESALEMKSAVERAVNNADCLIMAAAVSDWRPARISAKKLKRRPGRTALELVENPDILAGIGRRKKKGLVLVGFALETDDVERNALGKLRKKGLDMIVANAAGRGAGPFGDNDAHVMIMDRRGMKTELRGVAKRLAAKIILDKVFDYNI
jgi:phosphopantothenoylcysteine decarboxylase/phosphopantothenate--cysteine ligase